MFCKVAIAHIYDDPSSHFKYLSLLDATQAEQRIFAIFVVTTPARPPEHFALTIVARLKGGSREYRLAGHQQESSPCRIKDCRPSSFRFPGDLPLVIRLSFWASCDYNSRSFCRPAVGLQDTGSSPV